MSAPCSASMCCWGWIAGLHHGGAGHQLQTRPQAGLDPVRRHAGAHQPRPHGLLRQKVPQGASSTASIGISGGPGDPAVDADGAVRHAGLCAAAGDGDRHQHPLLLLIALVGWALYVLQRRYRAVQLKLRRQSSVLRSPLYISISETIRGAPPCAWPGPSASHWIQVLHHYDNNLRSWFPTTSINRWLGMHQTLLSAALVGAVALMVAFGNSPLLGAVAITYAFTASAMLNS